MTDASLELQGLVIATLKAAPAVTAIVGSRVYDNVPRDTSGNVTAQFPYISLGPSQVVPDDAECIPASEVFVQIDVWSRAVGFPECKRIAEAVRAALHNQDLSLTDNALVSIGLESRRDLRDPDGKTSHSALTFRAVVEHD